MISVATVPGSQKPHLLFIMFIIFIFYYFKRSQDKKITETEHKRKIEAINIFYSYGAALALVSVIIISAAYIRST